MIGYENFTSEVLLATRKHKVGTNKKADLL